jgi:hypothetical protein
VCVRVVCVTKHTTCTCWFAQAQVKSDVFARARKMQATSRNKQKLAAARVVAKKRKNKSAKGNNRTVKKFKAPTLVNAVLFSFLYFFLSFVFFSVCFVCLLSILLFPFSISCVYCNLCVRRRPTWRPSFRGSQSPRRPRQPR